MGHTTEFAVALLAYFFFFADGSWQTECATLRAGWVARVLGFHLACEVVFVGFWHWLTYASRFAAALRPFKFNQKNQYEPTAYDAGGARVGMVTSSSGHLQREVFYTTLGWLKSGLWQVAMTWAWASGRLPVAPVFGDRRALNLLGLHCITYWREVHFYWCHRGMHPWFNIKRGLLDGDVGAFLYRHAHSLHHKSMNPGPWSRARSFFFFRRSPAHGRARRRPLDAPDRALPVLLVRLAPAPRLHRPPDAFPVRAPASPRPFRRLTAAAQVRQVPRGHLAHRRPRRHRRTQLQGRLPLAPPLQARGGVRRRRRVRNCRS